MGRGKEGGGRRRREVGRGKEGKKEGEDKGGKVGRGDEGTKLTRDLSRVSSQWLQRTNNSSSLSLS